MRLIDPVAAVNELRLRLGMLRQIHRRQDDASVMRTPYCGECADDWPCATIRILNTGERR